jgi:hypothetical protein
LRPTTLLFVSKCDQRELLLPRKSRSIDGSLPDRIANSPTRILQVMAPAV